MEEISEFENNSGPKVTIVGAGIAGIAAACLLHSHNFQVVVLEAESRIGGRLHTVRSGEGKLELGAQWLLGEKKVNPLWKFVLDSGLFPEADCFHSGEGRGLYVTEKGSRIDPKLVEVVQRVMSKADKECCKFLSFQKDNQPISLRNSEYSTPKSVEHFFRTSFLQHLEKCNDSLHVRHLKEGLYRWHMLFYCLDNACHTLKNVSAMTWGEYQHLDDKFWMNIPVGYSGIAQALSSTLPTGAVQTDQKVLSIEWDDSFSYADLDIYANRPLNIFDKHVASRKNFKARVTCEDGSVYLSDHVLVTVSLGVLKKCHKSMFKPQLPWRKCRVIQNMGFGTLNKIFLLFNEPFWDSTVEGFQLVWTDTDSNHKCGLQNEGYPWVRDITGFDVLPSHKNVLLGWIGRRGAEIIEKMSDEEVGEGCICLLEQFLRRKITGLHKIIRSCWHSNANFYGSYSFRTIENDLEGSHTDDLQEPCYADNENGCKYPVLLFAGEATEKEHFSTVHGAHISGEREAHRLIHFYEKEA